MSGFCAHNQGLYNRRTLKPYYNVDRLFCSGCHQVMEIRKENNSISGFLATRDPNGIIRIGENTYVLSAPCKAILKQYEDVFYLIDQVAEKLPDGQNDPNVIALFHHLINATLEKLSMQEDCNLQLLGNDISSNQDEKMGR